MKSTTIHTFHAILAALQILNLNTAVVTDSKAVPVLLCAIITGIQTFLLQQGIKIEPSPKQDPAVTLK